MKMYKSFLMLCAGFTVAACSNDDIVDQSNQPAPAGQAYMSLNIASGNSIGTRANGEDVNSEGGEATINDVKIVLFDSNEFFLETKDLTSAQYTLKKDNGTPGTAGEAFTVPATTAKALIVINGSTDINAAFSNATTLDTWGDINQALTGVTAESMTGASLNAFTMLNAGVVNLGALVNVNTYETAAAALADRAEIKVDRLVAKVKVGAVSPTMTASVDGKNIGTATFQKWALNVVNTVMFPYSEIFVIPNGTADTDYRIDPNYDWSAPDFTQFTLTKTTDYTTSKFSTDTKYAVENTMTKDNATKGQTTSVLPAFTYFPYLSGTTTPMTGSWYSMGGKYYQDLTEVQAKYADAVTAVNAGTASSAQVIIKASCENFFNALPNGTAANFGALTTTILDGLANGGQYSKPTDATTANVRLNYYQKGLCFYSVFIEHDQALVDADLDETGRFGVVRNNFYTLSINSIGLPGTPYVPEDKPTDPVITPDAYISVQVTVNPWTGWTQNVDL